MKYFILLFLLFAGKTVFSQSDIRVKVLKMNVPDKVMLFDSSTKSNGINKIYVTFLGCVNSKNGQYKILTWKRIWGSNQHSTGRIYIYNGSNKFLGYYSVGSGTDLPTSVFKNQLLFTNKFRPSCDSNLVTKVNFANGLPKEFFLKCKGDYGDIYKLSLRE
jgi:hypothetical protein